MSGDTALDGETFEEMGGMWGTWGGQGLTLLGGHVGELGGTRVGT